MKWLQKKISGGFKNEQNFESRFERSYWFFGIDTTFRKKYFNPGKKFQNL